MRQVLRVSIPAIVVSLAIAACGSSSTSSTMHSSASAQSSANTTSGSSGAIVRTASNAALGTILVNSQGMTLYHLSVEQNGKFICTSSACVSVWHPVLSTSGATPSGVGSLGTVRRPDGTVQVTYKGTPLYTFTQDLHPGETKGQGIKDVGTWSVVTTGSASSASGTGGTTTTTTPAPSTGYHY